MLLSEVTIENIKEFKDLYTWICSLPIDGANRRTLMDLIDITCEINEKHLMQKYGLNEDIDYV